MRLSVCAAVLDLERKLGDWIARVSQYADELILLVDSAAAPETFELARRHADVVRIFEHGPTVNRVLQTLFLQAGGDWILHLDDDEFASRGLVNSLPELMADRSVTHYRLPLRWVVSDPGGRPAWLASYPWHPCSKPALFRNIHGLFHHSGRQHRQTEILGQYRLLEGEAGCIYHLDLLWRGRAAREHKVEHRYGADPGRRCAEYYLYEDYRDSLVYARLDPEELEVPPPSQRRSTGDRHRTADFDPTPLRIEPPEACMETDRELDLRAEFLSHETPERMLAGHGYAVALRLRNCGRRAWLNHGARDGPIYVSYHWRRAGGDEVIHDGDRSYLPRPIPPGAEVLLTAGVWAPGDPGRYRLVWDLVHEGSAWFSEVGGPVLTVEVEVLAAG